MEPLGRAVRYPHQVHIEELYELLIEYSDLRPNKPLVLLKRRGQVPALQLAQTAYHGACVAMTMRESSSQHPLSWLSCPK